jgi:cytochrome c
VHRWGDERVHQAALARRNRGSPRGRALCDPARGYWPDAAHAEEVGDIATGRRLAETWCSSCHVVGPTRDTVVSNGAPTFRAIAADKSITVLSLRAFLQTSHARMPDLHLSRDEVDNLASYILSLRTK